MEALRSWALSVCMACIAAAILQQFAADKTRFSVIKMVATLYILVVALMPLQALRYPDTRVSLPQIDSAEGVTMDANTLVLQQTKASLETELLTVCHNNGVEPLAASITLETVQQEVIVAQIYLQVASESEKAVLESAIQAWIAIKPHIDVKEGI